MCKLEVGKYYRTRDGENTFGPVTLYRSTDLFYQFKAARAGGGFNFFSEDGRLFADHEVGYDLVEEVLKPLLLEVGKSYRTRDGEFVLGPVLEFCGECGYPFAVKTSAGMVVLREDGRLYAGEDHLYDLVEEVSDAT